MIRRRRQVFERLVMAAGATLILGIPSALRWLWWVHLLLDVAVVVYAVRLRRWKMQEQLRQRVVEIGPAEEGVPEVEEIPAARSFYTGA